MKTEAENMAADAEKKNKKNVAIRKNLPQKCGYVAVLGRPNAGKSSLVNFLVGEEVAVVSRRRQTTRNSILGVKNYVCQNGQHCQMIFIDTPGIHHSKNNLDRFMMKNVRSALATADVVLYLFDGSAAMDEEEVQYIKKLCAEVQNLLILQTKSDKKQVSEFDKFFDKLFGGFCDGFCDEPFKREERFGKEEKFEKIKISTFSGENMQILCEKIAKMLPERDFLFEEDEFTDKSVAFLICEKIRGICLEMFDNEIPHGVAVNVTNFDESENVAKIDVELVCERAQHKGIIIGKGGANLKAIGTEARKYAQQLLGKKVAIKIFVKVDEAWRDKNISANGYF